MRLHDLPPPPWPVRWCNFLDILLKGWPPSVGFNFGCACGLAVGLHLGMFVAWLSMPEDPDPNPPMVEAEDE